mmetsp:Transcript_26189/g.68013  ORF Transcript_26189/g.68013 Transcript_26189/m.68013 type:complete len:251 (+) Transcript_26189:248-1000(+)
MVALPSKSGQRNSFVSHQVKQLGHDVEFGPFDVHFEDQKCFMAGGVAKVVLQPRRQVDRMHIVNAGFRDSFFPLDCCTSSAQKRFCAPRQAEPLIIRSRCCRDQCIPHRACCRLLRHRQPLLPQFTGVVACPLGGVVQQVLHYGVDTPENAIKLVLRGGTVVMASEMLDGCRCGSARRERRFREWTISVQMLSETVQVGPHHWCGLEQVHFPRQIGHVGVREPIGAKDAPQTCRVAPIRSHVHVDESINI